MINKRLLNWSYVLSSFCKTQPRFTLATKLSKKIFKLYQATFFFTGFTSLCEGYCTLTINVCKDNKELGVTLNITSLNVSISSSSSKLKKVVIITCNFLSATDPDNCSRFQFCFLFLFFLSQFSSSQLETMS